MLPSRTSSFSGQWRLPHLLPQTNKNSFALSLTGVTQFLMDSGCYQLKNSMGEGRIRVIAAWTVDQSSRQSPACLSGSVDWSPPDRHRRVPALLTRRASRRRGYCRSSGSVPSSPDGPAQPASAVAVQAAEWPQSWPVEIPLSLAPVITWLVLHPRVLSRLRGSRGRHVTSCLTAGEQTATSPPDGRRKPATSAVHQLPHRGRLPKIATVADLSSAPVPGTSAFQPTSSGSLEAAPGIVPDDSSPATSPQQQQCFIHTQGKSSLKFASSSTSLTDSTAQSR